MSGPPVAFSRVNTGLDNWFLDRRTQTYGMLEQAMEDKSRDALMSDRRRLEPAIRARCNDSGGMEATVSTTR